MIVNQLFALVAVSGKSIPELPINLIGNDENCCEKLTKELKQFGEEQGGLKELIREVLKKQIKLQSDFTEYQKVVNERASLMKKQINDLKEKLNNQKEVKPQTSKYDAYKTGEKDAFGKSCLSKDGEYLWLIENAKSQAHIARTYNKTNKKRRCFSSQEIHQLFGGDGVGTEKQMSTFVWEAIQKIRNDK